MKKDNKINYNNINNISKIQFVYDEYQKLFDLKNKKLITLNTQLFLEYFIRKKHFINLNQFEYLLDSRFLKNVLLVKYNIKKKVIAGSEVIYEIFNYASQNKKKIVLVGLDQKDHLKFEKKILKLYPDIKYRLFSPQLNIEDLFDKTKKENLFNSIFEYKPDYILVALGVYKQELFIEQLDLKFQKCDLCYNFMIGIGGSLDFFINKQRGAPKIIKKLSLEWLWRALTNKKILSRLINDLEIFKYL